MSKTLTYRIRQALNAGEQHEARKLIRIRQRSWAALDNKLSSPVQQALLLGQLTHAFNLCETRNRELCRVVGEVEPVIICDKCTQPQVLDRPMCRYCGGRLPYQPTNSGE